MAGVTFYMSGRAKKLKTLPQLITSETVAAVRRGTRVVRKEIHSEYTKRGLGRALLEGRGSRILGGSSLKTIIRAATTRHTGDEIRTGVWVKGSAALVAMGGRTAKHAISPSRQRFLETRAAASTSLDASKAMWRRIEFERMSGSGSFGLKGALSNQARGGGFFASGTVQHPGSQFKKDDFMGRGASRGTPRFREEVAKGLARVAEVVARG